MNDKIVKRGSFKVKIHEMELLDYEISRIVINSLLDAGYDIVTEPIKDKYNQPCGEKISVYRIDNRY